MALFVITALDRAGALELRRAERPAHRAYLESQMALIKVAGPLLDAAGEMIGSLFIVEAPDLEAARAFSAGDPFSRIGLFETVQIQPWSLSFGGFA